MGPRFVCIVVGLFGLWSLATLIPGAICTATSAMSGEELVQQLARGARQEGRLRAAAVSSLSARGSNELADAFKRRFNLPIDVKIDLTSGGTAIAFEAISEHKAGVRPSYDVRNFTEESVLLLKGAGVAERIDNWEQILAGIDAKAYKVRRGLSPHPLEGHGFTWGTRPHALLYNPRLIAEKDLPKTMKQYGDPKYKGKFSVPPNITRAMLGPTIYDKAEWLEIVKTWGQNKGHILRFPSGVSRLLLGELAFLYANAPDYFAEKAKDPNAPIGVSFFEDLPWVHLALNTVLKGARSPNAAKLYALWSMSEEASHIYEKHADAPNIFLETGATAREIMRVYRERNIKPMTWFDSPKTLDVFLWYETKEGMEYAKLLDRAQREGR
jgi:ABC-type Fe3+ transport system substrate-binding protein